MELYKSYIGGLTTAACLTGMNNRSAVAVLKMAVFVLTGAGSGPESITSASDRLWATKNSALLQWVLVSSCSVEIG